MVNWHTLDDDEFVPRCTVCQERLPASAPMRWLCAIHQPLLAERREAGVSTVDLDPRWGDRLIDWRDRPAALNDEPAADVLRFWARRDRWILFMRGYTSRLPDWLAVNVDSHEIRRAANVGAGEIDDILAAVQPLSEDQIAEQWGRPEPIPRPLRPYEQPGQPAHLSALVEDAPMPVYGPAGNPLGLELQSMSHSGAEEISLTFASQKLGGARIVVAIGSSSPRRRRHITQRPVPREWAEELNVHPAIQTFVRLAANGRTSNVTMPRGAPHEWGGTVAIVATTFAAEIVSWPDAGPFCAFTLTTADEQVTGGVLGLSRSDLVDLLADLVPLNAHPDLVAQYQAELDRRLAESERAWQAGHPPSVDPEIYNQPLLIWPHSEHGMGFGGMMAWSAGSDPPPEPQFRPRQLALKNLSDQPVTFRKDRWDFRSGSFTLTTLRGRALSVVESRGIECSPVAGQPNVLSCRSTAERVRVAFTTTRNTT